MQSSILFGYSWLRSSVFTAESFLIPIADFLATGRPPRLPISDLTFFLRIRRSLRKLWRDDALRISQGVYPASVLVSGATVQPMDHLRRLPKIFLEAMGSSRRRKAKQTKEFSASAKRKGEGLPSYYSRNFHFQKDGYLSQDSAELYDHQVELLFAGSTGAMRRLILAPLKRHFDGSNGAGLRFLELGCGTGSATLFLRAAFPEAEIIAIDLSKPYLELAASRLPEVTFRSAKAEKLPWKKGEFDAVVSVFLFHELPLAVRGEVLSEARRVLKPGGMFAYADSLQLGDNPELDESLKLFPVEFHEPFYTNYIKNPMEGLLQAAGFKVVEKDVGFFSKALAALSPPASPRPKKKAKARKA